MKKGLFFIVFLMATKVFAQDVIVKNDGTTVLSKVLEVGVSEVKYKKYSNLDGPVYSISKTDIMSINYENGDKESFNNEENKGLQINPQTANTSDTSDTEEYTLEAGTNIPIQNVRYVRAADLSKGQTVEFQVSRDVKVKGVEVIPFGTTVKGTVYKARRSSWFGTKGKLGVQIDKISMPNGIDIPLYNGDVYVTGKNRSTLSVLLFLFVAWPCCFITGSKAELPANYEVTAKVANPVVFKNEGGELVPRLIEGQTDRGDIYPYYALIKLKTGDKIKAQILSESADIINYKRMSKPNGSTYQMKKKNVKRIEKL